jgi:hypothetical protein
MTDATFLQQCGISPPPVDELNRAAISAMTLNPTATLEFRNHVRSLLKIADILKGEYAVDSRQVF